MAVQLEFTEVLKGEGWYAVAKRLGGDQSTQANKDKNANYLAAASGRKDVSAILFENQIIWYDPAKLITAPPIPPTPDPILGFTTYTAADATKWKTTHPEYQRLLSSWVGRLSRGTEITCQVPSAIPTANSVGSQQLIESSLWSKGQALLYRANLEPARRTAVIAKIDQFIAMTRTLPVDNEFRLPLGWALSNFVEAMWIVDYDRDKARDFLKWSLQHMDWWGGGNWLRLFAAVRIMIGGFLKESAVLADGADYLLYVSRRCGYEPIFDGGTVTALHGYASRNDPTTMWPGKKADLTPDYRATSDHWDNGLAMGGAGSASQLSTTNSTAPSQMQKGADCEDFRDLSHTTFSIKSIADACNTLRNNGIPISPEVHARFLAFTAHHGQRVYDWITTGKVNSWPTPAGGAGGQGLAWGWYSARKYFGTETPPVVELLLAHTTIKSSPPGGANHQSCEAFAEGTY